MPHTTSSPAGRAAPLEPQPRSTTLPRGRDHRPDRVFSPLASGLGLQLCWACAISAALWAAVFWALG